jgi:hypothetical protein
MGGKIIVADSGATDTDRSRAISETSGARVVAVHERAYGNALMGGIAAARGKFI